MLNYLVRRLLLFIPTLVAISLLAFVISINAPGDPVERIVSGSGDDAQSAGFAGQNAQKKYWRNKLGLDLPVFYISIKPLSEPDLTQIVTENSERNSLLRLSNESGNPETTLQLYQARTALTEAIQNKIPVNGDSSNLFRDLIALKYAQTTADITFRFEKIRAELSKSGQIDSGIKQAIDGFDTGLNDFKQQVTRWKNFVPAISFHLHNQYHRWIFGDGNWLTGSGSVTSRGIIRGDFGLSYQTRQPVSDVISEKVGWSLFFAIASILLAYLISIPVGVYAGSGKFKSFDKWSTLIVFLLYSMPSFWVATILLMTFANPDVLHWFPASGVLPVTGYPDGAGLFLKLKLSLPYIILPLICYTYSSFAFISRTVRVSMIESMSQDYIRTAYAKGLPFNKIVFTHAFRNSLLPLITIFANVFPLAIGGSVILETIFTIPGMGYETIQSIYNQNYPMIVAIFTIAGVLTITGYLIADLLYAWADPRISYSANTGKNE